VINRHGWALQNFSYSNQSSATNSLINELKSAQFQSDLATLGLMGWYAEMIKSQEAFEIIFNQKASSQNKKESVEKKEAQIPVNQDIDQLISYINSVINFKANDEAWNNVYNDVEGIVKQFSTTAKARRSNQKPDDTNPENTPDKP